MKKIKGILLFGILTLLGIGSSFGNELDQVNHLSVFNKLGYGLVDLSCGGYYCSAPGLINGTIRPSGSADRFTYMVFLLQFNKGGGFELSGYSSNYGRYVRLMTVPPLSSLPVINDPLGPTQDVDPGIGEDIPPLIFDSSLNYFTFSYANQLMYNGQSFYNLSVGNNYQLEYCFYGLNYSLSCVYKNLENSLDYKFFHFNLNLNTLQFEENSGFIIDPVSGTNYSFVYSFDSQNRIMYNIYNGQSDSVSDFSSFSVIDKGYIDVTSLTFLNRTFVSDLNLGYFGDIVYNSGNFYFQSNSVLFVATGNNNYLESSPALVLYQYSSVPNILGGNGGNGGSGNVSSYSGNVSLSTCIDTEICWDYTGSDGNIVRMCTTQCVSSGVIASGGYIGSDGTYYFVNSPISIEDSLKTDNPENMFTGSYIDSGGILSLSYFTDYFQPGAKKIGVCPFKYYEGPLDFMTKLKIGDVYLLMPVLCFYSAFQQGKNVSFFDQYDVNDGLFSQPMLYGESDNHKLLFAFFDVLFSIGLLGLIRYLSRHLF